MGSKPSKISASRGAAILGLSKWKSSAGVWLQIMEERKPGFCEINNYIKPVRSESAAINWGLAFENSIIELATQSQGMFIPLETQEKSYSHEEYDFITCHIDGMYTNGHLHEGKTTNSRTYFNKWGDPETNQIPADYKVQVQQQMMLTGSPIAIVSVLVFPKMQDEFGDLKPEEYTHWARTLYEMGFFHQYAVEADKKVQNMMLEIYKEFWFKNVLEETFPSFQVYDDIRKLVREPFGTIVADENTYRLSQTYKQIGDEMKKGKESKEKLKTEILKYMHKEAQLDGFEIDDDSHEKWILRDGTGRKLHQFDGRKFR